MTYPKQGTILVGNYKVGDKVFYDTGFYSVVTCSEDEKFLILEDDKERLAVSVDKCSKFAAQETVTTPEAAK